MKLLRLFDKILNKIDWNIVIPIKASSRKKKLKRTDFTIISNNCWGGRIYEYFNLPKQNPTVGSYFYAEDYLKFCSNLKYYLSIELSFITANDSKHKDDLYRKGEQNVIIGKLDDVEIIFLHYSDKQVIKQKWQRRINRINWDNIILKFSYQNNCTDDRIRDFMSIKDYPKICFVGEEIENCEGVLFYPRHNNKETVDETVNIGRYYNLINLLNSKM